MCNLFKSAEERARQDMEIITRAVNKGLINCLSREQLQKAKEWGLIKYSKPRSSGRSSSSASSEYKERRKALAKEQREVAKEKQRLDKKLKELHSKSKPTRRRSTKDTRETVDHPIFGKIKLNKFD